VTTCDLHDAIDSDDAAPTRTDHTPAAVALAVAAGHLIEAGVHAHRFMNLADASRRLGISRVRVTGLSALMPLAPEIQSEILALRVGDPLGNLSERALLEVVAGHADWRVQRWWWSVLAQPFDPNWLAEWIPSKTAFPSGKRARSGDQAIGDLPLGKLVELVVRRRGHRDTAPRREALLTTLADGGAGAPAMLTDVARILAMSPVQLANEFELLHGHRPPSRNPEYLRRRVAWAVQAVKLGGLPKPIAGKVMELKEHLPERWQEAFAAVGRVHVTRVHRVARRVAS
jgi:hypothetical protein